MVPAVVAMSVSVVSVTSIEVEELWSGSYLVGVVIVVCRLFSMRKLKRFGLSCSMFLFRSPCIVIDVCGWFVCIWSIAFLRLSVNVGSVFGLLYALMIVCIGLLVWRLLCIWIVMVAVLLISRLRVVVWSVFLMYTVMSVLCMAV